MCTSTVPYAISASGFFLLLWSLITNNPFPYSPVSNRFFMLHNKYLTVLDLDSLLCSSTDGNSWSVVSRVTKPPKLSDTFSSNAITYNSNYYLVSSNGTLWTGTSCTSWTSRSSGLPWSTKPRHGATLQIVYDGSSYWLVYGGGYNPSTYVCHYDSYATNDGYTWYKFTVPNLGNGCRFLTTLDFNYQYYLLTTDSVYSFQGSGYDFSFDYEYEVNGPIYAQTVVWEEYTTVQGEYIVDRSSGSHGTSTLSVMAQNALRSLRNNNVSLPVRTRIIHPGNSTYLPVIRNTVYVWMSFYAIDDPSNPQPPHNRYSFSHDLSTWNDEGQLAPYQPAYNGLVFVDSFPSTGVYYFLVGGYTLPGQQGMDPNVWSGSAIYYDPSDTVATVTAQPSTSSSRTPSSSPSPSNSASPSNSPTSSSSRSSSPTSSSSHSSSPSHSPSHSSTPTAYPSSCPMGHYGFHCQVCPGYNPLAGVCNGHGECNGEGTAIGNGNCICFTGWTGPTCADSLEMSTSTKIAIGGGVGGVTVAIFIVGLWCHRRGYHFRRPPKGKGKGSGGLLDEENYDDDEGFDRTDGWGNGKSNNTKKNSNPSPNPPAPSAPWMEFGNTSSSSSYPTPDDDPAPSSHYVPPNISRTPTIDPVDTHEITTMIINTIDTIDLLSHGGDIAPTLFQLCTRLDDISPKVVGNRWLARDKLHEWVNQLRKMPAHQPLTTEQKKQLYSDVEFLHHEYGRLLRTYYRKK